MKKFLFFILIIALTVPAFARPDSLKGLQHARFVVDMNQGNANLLKLRLALVLETIENITADGVTPLVVVAFRGGATKFMTENDDYIVQEDLQAKAEIHKLISELSKKGVKLEQCSIALRMLGVDKKEVYPAVNVVQNGYVSLIGYQNQGYAILPME